MTECWTHVSTRRFNKATQCAAADESGRVRSKWKRRQTAEGGPTRLTVLGTNVKPVESQGRVLTSHTPEPDEPAHCSQHSVPTHRHGDTVPTRPKSINERKMPPSTKMQKDTETYRDRQTDRHTDTLHTSHITYVGCCAVFNNTLHLSTLSIHTFYILFSCRCQSHRNVSISNVKQYKLNQKRQPSFIWSRDIVYFYLLSTDYSLVSYSRSLW